MLRPRRNTLHVFISSPGDCAEERARMRDVVRRVSESEEAQAADIELKPLLWEDLPPGPAEPGDLQSRVNALLDRYGLKRYEIYAGAMKATLGTPTAKFRSGTIEELEGAIAGHRRAQAPAEVLFYFIDTPDVPPAVLAFRQELSARGFLYSIVPDGAELERRFTAHLTRIVMEWSLWRNRLRRGVRTMRSAGTIAAAMLLVVVLALYLQFDRGGARRVQEALRAQGPAAALAAYEREAPYLVAHKLFTRRELRHGVVEALQRGTFEDTSAASMAVLWQRTHRAGLWSTDDADGRRLLRRIAARRLMEALIADGVDVAEWPVRCRPFELKALRELASEAARSRALAQWPRDQRTAACVLGQAWPQLAELAADDGDAQVALVQHAPPDVAGRWIREHVTKQSSDADVHQIVLAVEQRKDPAVLSALLERLQARHIDPEVHRDDLLRALEDVDAPAFAPFAIHHLGLIAQGHGGVPEVYPVLLAIVPSRPPLPEPHLDALLRPVRDGSASSDYEVAVYRAIAALRDRRARGLLDRQYQEYATERTSFGAAQKAALIDALIAVDTPEMAGRALVLARIARRETEAVGTNDWIVQAAYLRALTRDLAAWPRHAGYVRALFARRASADLSAFGYDFEPAAVDLVGKLTATQILELLALPRGIVSDEVEGKWEPRWYVLRALGDSKSTAGEAVANEVFGHLPVAADARNSAARAMARSGPKIARIFLAREYLRDPVANREYLNILGDAGAEAFFLERIAAGAGEEILEAAARLPDDAARCRVFARATQSLAATRPSKLWSGAGGCRIVNDALIAAAVREVKEGKESRVAAMKYLAAIGREKGVVDDAVNVLRTADAFDWFALAQEMPSRVGKESSVEKLLGDRPLLAVKDGMEPGAFTAGSRSVWNPLLAVYAAREDAAAARTLLEWAQRSRPVAVFGSAADAPVLYRAYCLWLAAPAARRLPIDVLASDYGVPQLLAENNPPLVRAAAAVCLGAS